jgi:hypothetical protein
MKPRNALIALGLALWTAPAAALDRSGAIEAAKREMKSHCKAGTFCTFSAKAEGDKWHVRVEHPGGQAILIFNHAGKVIGRIEGK